MTIRDLTVLIPAFDEARRIEATLERVLTWCATQEGKTEVLVVDDGSSDGTAELVARRFGERVRVLRRPVRGGKGAAVRSGVAQARGEWILMSDADLSIPIEEFAKLAAHADEAPVVIGSKRAPGSELAYPLLRRMFGGLGQKLIACCVVSGFHDTQCGFKLYRADVARALFAQQRLDGFGFDFEVLYLARRAGQRVVEVPVRCEHQLGSTVRVKTYLIVLGEVARVSWYRSTGAYGKPS